MRAVTSCQAQLVEHLIRPDMTALVLDLFRLVPSATNMRVNTLHKICHGFVQYQQYHLHQPHTGGQCCKDLQLFEDPVPTVPTTLWSPNHPQVKTNLHPSPHDIPPLRFLLDFCLNSPYCVWLGGVQDAEESNVRQKQVQLQKEG